VSVTCGCTQTVLEQMFLKVDLKLPVKYPQITSPVFETEKYIYITYRDDTQDTLTIKATVHE
jgi:hypothetical protein